jgi:transposase IS66-like protein
MRRRDGSIAARSLPSSFPANSQFFKLCGAQHNRKIWLFAGSDEGGRRADILYSLIESAKRVGVNPEAYLKDLLERISVSSCLEPLSQRGLKLLDPSICFRLFHAVNAHDVLLASRAQLDSPTVNEVLPWVEGVAIETTPLLGLDSRPSVGFESFADLPCDGRGREREEP